MGWGGESERRKGKKKKVSLSFEIRTIYWDNTKKDITATTVLIKEYTKQVVHSATAHHPEPNAPPLPPLKAESPPSPLPIYVLSMMSHGMEYLLGQFRSAVLAVPPPRFLWKLTLFQLNPGQDVTRKFCASTFFLTGCRVTDETLHLVPNKENFWLTLQLNCGQNVSNVIVCDL